MVMISPGQAIELSQCFGLTKRFADDVLPTATPTDLAFQAAATADASDS